MFKDSLFIAVFLFLVVFRVHKREKKGRFYLNVLIVEDERGGEEVKTPLSYVPVGVDPMNLKPWRRRS